MNQATARAPVAVAEWMDGLELGVGYGGLGDSWKIVRGSRSSPDPGAVQGPDPAEGARNAASAGLVPRPPIQFWSVRTMPAKRASLVPSSKT